MVPLTLINERQLLGTACDRKAYASSLSLHSALMGRYSHSRAICTFLGLYSVARWCSACTIFEFADSGFAANAIHLMHAVPIFDGNNGTFFLDNSQVRLGCRSLQHLCTFNGTGT